MSAVSSFVFLSCHLAPMFSVSITDLHLPVFQVFCRAPHGFQVGAHFTTWTHFRTVALNVCTRPTVLPLVCLVCLADCQATVISYILFWPCVLLPTSQVCHVLDPVTWPGSKTVYFCFCFFFKIFPKLLNMYLSVCSTTIQFSNQDQNIKSYFPFFHEKSLIF